MARYKQARRMEHADQAPVKARNTWTREQRLTLHLLHDKELSLTPAQRLEAFNTIFVDHLRQHGYPRGLEPRIFYMQYYEASKTEKSTWAANWASIVAGPRTAEEVREKERLLQRVKQLTAALPATAQAAPPTGPWVTQTGTRRASGSEHQRRLAVDSSSTPASHNTPSTGHLFEDAEIGEDPRPCAQTTRASHAATPLSQFLSSRLRSDVFDLMDSDDELPVPETPVSMRRPKRKAVSTAPELAFDTALDVAPKIESDSDHEFILDQPPTPRKRVRTNPAVVIPVTPAENTTRRSGVRGPPPSFSAGSGPKRGMMTPRKTPSSVLSRRAMATKEYPRPNGLLMLTEPELRMTKAPLVPPTEAEAHPPLAGLLFRYWTDDCFSRLNDDGEFVAGKFANFSAFGADSQPKPTLQDFKYFWHDVGAHMNREPAPSPWISTCNHVTWIIRLAVQEAKKGVTSGRITLIDAHDVDHKSIFHAQPLHKELRKKRPFSNGAFRYQGMREFLVYHKIPKSAVLHTFTVRQLLRLAVSKPGVGDLLRLHYLEKSMTALKTLTQTLQSQGIRLDASSATAIAAVVRFFGLTPDAKTEHVMHIVSDIVQGWCLAVSYQTPEQWSALADNFASAMITPPFTGRWMKSYQRMKIAFLDGVRWSQGDVNARHRAERMRVMLTRARRIGLDDPARILRDELDAAKLEVMMYDQKQQQLLQGVSNHRAIADADVDDEDISPGT